MIDGYCSINIIYFSIRLPVSLRMYIKIYIHTLLQNNHVHIKLRHILIHDHQPSAAPSDGDHPSGWAQRPGPLWSFSAQSGKGPTKVSLLVWVLKEMLVLMFMMFCVLVLDYCCCCYSKLYVSSSHPPSPSFPSPSSLFPVFYVFLMFLQLAVPTCFLTGVVILLIAI